MTKPAAKPSGLVVVVYAETFLLLTERASTINRRRSNGSRIEERQIGFRRRSVDNSNSGQDAVFRVPLFVVGADARPVVRPVVCVPFLYPLAMALIISGLTPQSRRTAPGGLPVFTSLFGGRVWHTRHFNASTGRRSTDPLKMVNFRAKSPRRTPIDTAAKLRLLCLGNPVNHTRRGPLCRFRIATDAKRFWHEFLSC